MPPKSSKNSKSTPNQHDKRHENGLAPPGKRVTKQRSNGQLNGQASGKPASSVLPPQLPSTGLNQGIKFPRPADTTAEASSTAVASYHAAASEAGQRERTSSDASVEEYGRGSEMADQDYEQPSAAAESQYAHNAGSKHAGNTVSAVSTILAYYPLHDAISILILLLFLPPTLALVIQTLFASLTFVPPTAGLSLSTLPNVKDIFNTSTIAAPAIWTILLVDFIFGILWTLVWKPVQDIFLDMSQAAIAVSLSGAAAGSGGPTYSIATCALIVCVVHVLRYKAIHLTALDYLRSVIHKLDIGIQTDVPFSSSYHSPPPIERGWMFTFLRAILGIHIVSQGVTTCIRYSLLKANKKGQNSLATSKDDPEAIAGTESSARGNATHADGSPVLHSNPSTDGRQPGPSPARRDSKSRESGSKKKRKQANQARSQQPLWAAIASTKVTFVKEVEQREAAHDGREAANMQIDTSDTVTSTINQITNRIWITEVRDTSVFFCLNLSVGATGVTTADGREECQVPASIDKSKPFYVRVNGAAWGSTRILRANAQDQEHWSRDEFVVEVFGLAPLSTYHCEVITTTDLMVMCSASLITQPAPTAEQVALAPSHSSPTPALRPSSPITTLKQSILSAEAKLSDIRNRSKKTKRDHRTAHSDIKKEINILKSKLESSSGLDDKQDRRFQQIAQHKKQAEDATAELKEQIESLGEISSEQHADYDAKKRSHQSAADYRNAANKDFDNTKSEQDRELGALRSEVAAAESKKEKLTARSAQRAQDFEKLTAKHQADTVARQKRDSERALLLQERERQESEFLSHTVSMRAEAQSVTQKMQEVARQINALGNWPVQSRSGLQGYSAPPTPEGTLPGTTNGSLSPQNSSFPPIPYAPHHFQSQFDIPQPSATPASFAANGAPRGRSSSMLSQYSGFTDPGEDPIEPRHQQLWSLQASSTASAMLPERQASEGDVDASARESSTTNGSTNGSNSPRPDAKVFVPGNTPAKSVGTIGEPRKKVPQSPTPTSAGAARNGR